MIYVEGVIWFLSLCLFVIVVMGHSALSATSQDLLIVLFLVSSFVAFAAGLLAHRHLEDAP